MAFRHFSSFYYKSRAARVEYSIENTLRFYTTIFKSSSEQENSKKKVSGQNKNTSTNTHTLSRTHARMSLSIQFMYSHNLYNKLWYSREMMAML